MKRVTHMNKDITEYPNLKQIEQILWSKLQEIDLPNDIDAEGKKE